MFKGHLRHYNISVSHFVYTVGQIEKDNVMLFLYRVEISPCLDPRCSAKSKFSVSQERELLLSKYLDKVLSLPINTFTGVTL